MTESNLILNTDSYKASHFLQYPPNTSRISSYVESRGGAFEQGVFFGLQAYLKEYLSKPITKVDIDEAEATLTAHGLPFNRAGWEHILNKHGGYMPVEIEAIEEGTVLPTQNVLLQMQNTDPECFWVTNYLETSLLRAIWYPMTVATLSWHIKRIIKKYLEETTDNIDGLPFKLHDFGARGASSFETAAIGGMAHLVNFMGTDTISGLVAARKYYGAEMAGFSVPAAEHSTITSWGKENEEMAYSNMLDNFAGGGKVVAVVSDSYDIWNAIDNIWGKQLRARVISSGGTLVVRPDSGEPVEVVTKVISRLMDIFGATTNSKGYKVLPSYLRVIQGDGISSHMITNILQAMKEQGLSAENVAFGMGAELLQKVNRDTMKFTMNASAAEVDGQWREVFKEPITDKGKSSKRGLLALIRGESGQYSTIGKNEIDGHNNCLQPVFRNGILLRECSFDDIRQRSEEYLVSKELPLEA